VRQLALRVQLLPAAPLGGALLVGERALELLFDTAPLVELLIRSLQVLRGDGVTVVNLAVIANPSIRRGQAVWQHNEGGDGEAAADDGANDAASRATNRRVCIVRIGYRIMRW
jgi:hypothetical protein